MCFNSNISILSTYTNSNKKCNQEHRIITFKNSMRISIKSLKLQQLLHQIYYKTLLSLNKDGSRQSQTVSLAACRSKKKTAWRRGELGLFRTQRQPMQQSDRQTDRWRSRPEGQVK